MYLSQLKRPSFKYKIIFLKVKVTLLDAPRLATHLLWQVNQRGKQTLQVWPGPNTSLETYYMVLSCRKHNPIEKWVRSFRWINSIHLKMRRMIHLWKKHKFQYYLIKYIHLRNIHKLILRYNIINKIQTNKLFRVTRCYFNCFLGWTSIFSWDSPYFSIKEIVIFAINSGLFDYCGNTLTKTMYVHNPSH